MSAAHGRRLIIRCQEDFVFWSCVGKWRWAYELLRRDFCREVWP